MASSWNIDGLIQSVIDNEDPTKKENRRLGRAILIQPFLDKLKDMQDRARTEKKELKQDVADGIMSQDEMDAQIAQTKALIDDYEEFIKTLLK